MKTGYWVGVVLMCAITVSAQVPYSFNYQGVLRDGSGQLLHPPQRTVDFRLYNSPNSDTPLWGRNYAILLDTNGLFNVELSDSGAPLSGGKLVTTPALPLNLVVANNETLFMGLTVNNSTEIAPRQKLLSVPFAMMAGDVKTASGDFTASGVVTAEQGLTVPSPAKIQGFGTIPIGGIIMWWGTTGAIPDGWVLCNGANNTPNLCDKFILGAGSSYAANATGGVATVTLDATQLPNHQHSYKDGYYTESSAATKLLPGGGSDNIGADVTGSGNHDNDNNYIYWRPLFTDAYTGGGLPHQNMPPFYALYYIMRKQ
ncbi:MAG: hypothetical protein WCP12_15685 [bacterium]